jgi:hypothetical protein
VPDGSFRSGSVLLWQGWQVLHMIRVLLALSLVVLGSQLSQTSASAAPASDSVRVKARDGAAVREDSREDSEVLIDAACNDTYLLVGSNGPWREIFSVVGLPDEDTLDEDDDIFGWIHADQVNVGFDPPPVDCGAAPAESRANQVQSSSDRDV